MVDLDKINSIVYWALLSNLKIIKIFKNYENSKDLNTWKTFNNS